MIHARESEVFKYLRPKKKFPHVWCPGCGHGIAMGSILRAISSLDYEKDNVAMVSGIGCSSRMPAYVDFNTLHTLHGRAIPFATGVKLANPKLKTIVITGDGDATAIGGNHLIHAARRNLDITVILLNNNIYGMTGGQVSPATDFTGRGSTAPYGNPEHPFDIPKLVIAAGASFVARTTTFHVLAMDKIIRQGLEHHGFTLIEIFSQCPTYYGKWNRVGDAAEIMKIYKKDTYPVIRAENMSDEEKAGRYPIGILHQETKSEFLDEFNAIVDRLKGIEKPAPEKTEEKNEKKEQNDEKEKIEVK